MNDYNNPQNPGTGQPEGDSTYAYTHLHDSYATQGQPQQQAHSATQPQDGYPQQESYQNPYGQEGYHQHSAYGYQPPTAPTPPPKKAKKPGGGKRALTAVALVAACAVAGFGGGYAANLLEAGNEPAVVYRVPEDTSGNPTGSGGSGMSLSDVSEMAGQSVVSIVTENLVTDMFNRGQVQSGAGSGVIISENGYIITNHHVIEGAQNIKVTLPDGSEHEATLVGSDASSDIAVLKINVTGLTPATIGDSEALRVGEVCVAIGNPMGTLGGTVTDGIISALDREITVGNYTMNLLQMSAAVSPGNSGGGLFNGQGQLVGIVNAKSDGEGSEGLGFAIPVNDAMKVAEELISQGYVSGRPALGISGRNASSVLGDEVEGTYVATVTRGGPAAAAGLQEGDIIVGAGGETVNSFSALVNIINRHAVGDELELEVYRNGSTFTATVTLGEMLPEANAG